MFEHDCFDALDLAGRHGKAARPIGRVVEQRLVIPEVGRVAGHDGLGRVARRRQRGQGDEERRRALSEEGGPLLVAGVPSPQSA